MELDIVTAFTPGWSFAGGVLIGISALMVMGLFGRIAGISGISAGLIGAVVPLQGAPADKGWRIAFVIGLVLAPLLIWTLTGDAPAQTVPVSLIGMGLAGLIVGIGTGRGSGCTSGHGVCGLARLSPRSLAAVATFMTTGALTVYVLRHVIGG